MTRKMAVLLGKLIIRLSFRWYDLWMGLYYDTTHGILYFCPLPMVVLEFQILPVELK